jgi:hypothetical protein
MTTKYKDIDFTFKTRISNGMLYLTASAFDDSIQYEIKWDELKANNNLYIKQLLSDIQAGKVEISRPSIHSHCASSSLILTHQIYTKNASFHHSYELKYTLDSNIDELIAERKFIDTFRDELKTIKAVLTMLKESVYKKSLPQ